MKNKYLGAIFLLDVMIALSGCGLDDVKETADGVVSEFENFNDTVKPLERFRKILSDVDDYIFHRDDYKKEEKEDDDFVLEDDVAVESDTDSVDKYYPLVNEDVYNNLVEAKEAFEEFRKHGSASKQIKNSGDHLSDEEAKKIDKNMEQAYKLIVKYVKAYKKGDVETCYDIGQQLKDLAEEFGPDFFYSFKIGRFLPEKYQSPISDDYDSEGNIILENGNKIYLVGNPETIFSNFNYIDDSSDLYTKMYMDSLWYQEIPEVIIDQYGVFKEDKDVCFIMNFSDTMDLCSSEWNRLLQEGRDGYGDKKIDKMLPLGENYYFIKRVGENEVPVGELTDEQEERVKTVLNLQDAVISKKGDPYKVSETIQGMSSYEREYQK